MSRLELQTPNHAQLVVEGLYKDLERRIESSPPGLCPVDISRAFLELCHAQSCGKCVPCRVGLGQLKNLLTDVLDGKADIRTLTAIRETAQKLAALADPGTPVVLASKGIEKGTSLLLHQVVEQELSGKCPVVVLSGPSHAEEVGRRVPTAVVVASESRQAAVLVQEMFMNSRLRIYTSPDIVGVEVGAAMKNVIALCAGCCDGMGYGDNTKAMLMTRGLTEIARLGVAMGARKETFAGLAGLGDLIVTCTSMHSRNRRAGILVGQGRTIHQAMDELGGAVVEGYYAAASAKELADKAGVEMPITFGAYEVLYEEKDPHEVLRALMSRQARDELEEEQSWI